MKAHLSKKYTDNLNGKTYGFPSDLLDQDYKESPEYFLRASQAIIYRYFNNCCDLAYTNFENRHSIDTLRLYYRGQQSLEPIKDILIGPRRQDGCRRQTTWRINWTPLDIIPKKMGDVKSYLQKIKFEPILTAIDQEAVISRDMVIAATKLMTDKRYQELQEEIQAETANMGISLEGQNIETQGAVPFQNEEQVEMAAKTGNFLLTQEIAMKVLLDTTRYLSGSEVIDDMMVDDVLAIGAMAKKCYTEAGSYIQKEDYVDIGWLALPWSKYPDYRDRTWISELKRVTIGELRKTSDLSEESLIEVARLYNGADYNSSCRLANFDSTLSQARLSDGLGIAILDSIQVDVAYSYWKGNKSTKQTKVKRAKEGSLILNKVDSHYKLTDRDARKGKEVKEYKNQCLYKCSMIIGTDYIFDYGNDTDVAYKKGDDGKMAPVDPYTVYKVGGPSLTEKCIGFAEDANMALFQKRRIMRNLPTGPNIEIDRSALETMNIGGKIYKPSDIIALYRDEGFIIRDSQNHLGQQNSGRTINTIASDITVRMIECRNEIQSNIQNIELVTGLNGVFSAANPNPEVGKAVSEFAINATENSIYGIIKAKENHFELGCQVLLHYWKLSARYMGDSERNIPVFLDRTMKFMKITKDLADGELGIRVEAGVSEQEKAELMREVNQLTDFRRQAGVGGLLPSDKLLLIEMIRGGNLKQARLALSRIEEYRKQEDDLAASKRIQENSKEQQISSNQAAQNELQQTKVEGEQKVAIEQQTIDGNLQIENQKIQGQILLERIKGDNARRLAAQQAVYGNGSDSDYRKTG